MAGTKHIDALGHTVEHAKAQEPLLDASAKPASIERPMGGSDVMVPAQSPAEVEAQMLNRAGTGDESEEDRYGEGTGLGRFAPLTDDAHGREGATTYADRQPLKEAIRERSAAPDAEADEADEK